MLEKIYQSKFVKIKVDVDEFLLFITWREGIEKLEDSTYRKEVLNIISLVKKYEPRFVLDDARLFTMPIIPETQEWVALNAVDIYSQIIEKYAMIMPVEIFAKISTEQNISEVKRIGNTTESREFDTIEEAVKWLEIKDFYEE